MKKIIYDFVMTVIMFMGAAIAGSYYSFGNISEAISNSMTAVIGIYVALFTLIRSIAEKEITEYCIASVAVIVTTEKNDWNKLPRTLTLKTEKQRKCYILIKFSGSLKTLEKTEIIIRFPTSVTVSREDYKDLGDQPENEIKIALKDIASASGTATVALNASMGDQHLGEEKMTSCRLIKNTILSLVDFNSSEMGIEIKL